MKVTSYLSKVCIKLTLDPQLHSECEVKVYIGSTEGPNDLMLLLSCTFGSDGFVHFQTEQQMFL